MLNIFTKFLDKNIFYSKKIIFFVKIILTILILSLSSQLQASSILGTGSGALLGGDLTDPENNGIDGTDGSGGNWNWTSIDASIDKSWTGEGAWNAFDNRVGSGNDKWCCDGPTQWVYVQFSQAYVLSHFTITSGNDVSGRDPDIWKIQGSNNGSDWTDIFSYSNDGNSPFSARNQVIRYNGAEDDFATPSSYSYFRYLVTSVVSGSMHQINELEFFGDADSTAPTLNSSTPSDNATAIAADANIVLNFSENVDAESGNITIKKTSDNSTFETIDVTSGQVSGSGSTQITVNPSSNLDASTEYYVLIDASAFDDSSSNSYAGISSTTALSFTTANILPTLSSSTPTDNATGIALDANIVLNFSENVDAESGNITIKKTSDNSTFETIDVTSGQVSGSGSTQITVNPSSNLDVSTEYYVLIDASAFDDNLSGSYSGISSTSALNFTVDAMKNPTTDKDVVGSINVSSDQVKTAFIQSVAVVSNRLSFLRNNRTANNFTKQNLKFDFGNSLLNSLTEVVPVSNKLPESIIPDDWSMWTEGTLSMTRVAEQKDSSSQETNAQGLAFGLDKKIDDNKLYGFAFQFTQSNTDVGSNGSEVDSKFYNTSIYGTRPHNNNFVEGSLGVGLIQSDMIRVSGLNRLTGSRDGKQLFGSLNYGKNIINDGYKLIPKGRMDLSYTELDGYTEAGTDALSYSKQTIENGIAAFGLTINKEKIQEDKSIFHFGTFELGTDFSNSSTAIMHYVSDASTNYSITQGAHSNYLASAELGFKYDTKDNLNISGSYKRIQGYDNFRRIEHTDTLKFQLNFIPRRETEYAMTLDASEELATGFNISKDIKGFDFNLNAKKEFTNNKNNTAFVSLSKLF